MAESGQIPPHREGHKAATRAKAFTALFQLCEVKCGDYLAESCFDEDFKRAKMVYVDMQKNPDKPPPYDSTHLMALFGCVTVVLAAYVCSPGTALALAAGYGAVSRARQLKDQAHLALDAGNFNEARSLMITAKSLETDGFAGSDEEPPPLLEDITNITDPDARARPATSSLAVQALASAMRAIPANEHLPSVMLQYTVLRYASRCVYSSRICW